MMFGLKRISTVLGLLAVLATSATARVGCGPNANQLTADAVAGSLRASRSLAGHRIEIRASEGMVTLSGTLRSSAQKTEALARAQRVAGVTAIVDQLQVADRSVRPAQYQPEVAMGGGGLFHHGGGGNGPIYDGGDAMPPAGVDNMGGPMPEGPAGMTGATQAAMPGAPNYAWPS